MQKTDLRERKKERKIEMEEDSPARNFGGWTNVGRRCSSGAAEVGEARE